VCVVFTDGYVEVCVVLIRCCCGIGEWVWNCKRRKFISEGCLPWRRLIRRGNVVEVIKGII